MQELTTGHKTLKGMWAKSLPHISNVPCTNKENLLRTITRLYEPRKTNEIANSTVFQPKEYT